MEETAELQATTEEEVISSPVEQSESEAEQETKKKQAERPKERLKLFGVELVYLCFLAICVAVIGWLAENLVRLVTRGIIDSRFHLFPTIPTYGLIVFAVHILFGDPDDLRIFGKKIFKTSSKRNKILSNVFCLFIMYAAVFLGELVVGNVWEMISGVQLWDYSQMPLSITQYAGLIPTLGYGTGAYLLVKYCFWPVVRFLQKKANYKVILVFTLIASMLMIVDEGIMLVRFFLGESPVYWEILFW